MQSCIEHPRSCSRTFRPCEYARRSSSLPFPRLPIRICCATLAASPWPTKAQIQGFIQDYLGHRNIQHTVKYMASNPVRFQKLWR
jgi:hypothetical protein